MSSELDRIIEQVGKDKGIEKDILIDALQAAMISAAKKKFGPQRDLEAQYNPEIGEVELFEFKTVVELVTNPNVEISLEEAQKTDPEAEPGDSLGQKIPTETFGRIAAQTAKQVIMQKVRDAEREMVYDLYKDQKGELVHGTVQRFEKGDMLVNLDDCAFISHQIEDLIEVEDVIPQRYFLEVSSPGLDRVLKKEADFQRFCGEKASVKTREALAGRRNFKGRIVRCEQRVLELEDAGGERFEFSLDEIEKARLEYSGKF